VKKSVTILLAAIIFCSCSSVNKDKKGDGAAIVIRYINLRTVYAFLLNKDEKAKQMDEKRSKLETALEDDKNLLLKEEGDKETLYQRIKSNRQKLQELAVDEENHKAKLLNKIQAAVKNIAESSGADFIFNIGDEVIYAKKKYDVTEDVLSELERLESRSDPVSR